MRGCVGFFGGAGRWGVIGVGFLWEVWEGGCLSLRGKGQHIRCGTELEGR